MARLAIVFPPLERQREAAELLLERVEIDHAAAKSALQLARAFSKLRGDFLEDSISISDTGENSGLRESLGSLDSQAKDVLEILATASTVRTQFDSLAVSGPLVGLRNRMVAQEARIEQVADFSLLLSAVLVADLELVSSSGAIFDDVKLFSEGRMTVEKLSARFSDIAGRAHAARYVAVRMAGRAPIDLEGTDTGDLVRSLVDLNVAIDDLFTGIETVLDAAVVSFDSMGTGEGSVFSDGKAISAALGVLIDREHELGDSVVLIEQSLLTLRGIRDDGSFSLGELGDLLEDERIVLLSEMSTFLQQVPRLAAEIFGVDGEERKYLVLGQTSDELRAAGGFTSSVWLLRFRSGALIGEEYLEVATFEDPDSLDAYPEAFEELQLHMDAGRMYLRDAGWNPNFPSTGELATDIYETRTSTRVDGVISLTQWALIDLATANGGLEINSELIGSDELLSAMEDGTDEHGTQYLAVLFDLFLDSMSRSRIQQNFVEILTVITALFESKDLMIYSEDPTVQRLISELDWDGILPNPSHDRLAIIDSNVGWNKVDRNVERSFTYEVDISDVSSPGARLTLNYANDSTVGDNDCEIQSHVPNDYQVLLNCCYWNYFRVYIPGGTQLVDGDDLPLRRGSIASRVGKLDAGRATVQQLFDDNGDYISGLLVLGPQTSRDVILSYKLPGQVLVKNGEYLEYSLDIIAQSGTRGRAGTVVVKLPTGYEVAEIEPAPSNLLGGSVVFDIKSVQDEVINLKLLKTPG